MLRKSFSASPFAKRLAGVELADLASASSSIFALAGRALTRKELGAELLAQWPERDPTALAYAASYLLPLVQAPPRGMWDASSPVRWASAADLTDGPSSGRPLDELVLRYLAAFGARQRAGCADVVGPYPPGGGRRWLEARVERISGRSRPRLVGRAGRSSARLWHSRAAPLPPGVRQPVLRVCRPGPHLW